MNIVDTKLHAEEKTALASMVGRRLDKYRCDEFHFSPSVYQMVAVYVDGTPYAIENTTEVLDYFGDIDDVAVISIKQASPAEVASHVVGGTLVSTPINQVIQDIRIYEDTQVMSDGEQDLYSYSYTKAIVFVLPDRQLVFEKDVWFSEDIFVYRGPNAEAKIAAPEDDLEESTRHTLHAEREVVSLKESLDL